jgi:nucleoside-diphosphate-sugar epimerase
MRLLVIGNMGYVGSVLVSYIKDIYKEIEVTGLDSGLFGASVLSGQMLPETHVDQQYFLDARSIPDYVFQGVDAVVYLAAVSNDPMGNRFAAVTDQINHQGAVKAAEAAIRAGVKSFVFASSCSVYGAAEDGKSRKEGDDLNPLTAYARSKIDAEMSLKALPASGTAIRCLRFATACGISPRLRLDLVLNDFVANALATGKISVLSDGSPWRPLIDVQDMARAIDWACFHSLDQPRFLAVNTGCEEWNWQIRDLADGVAKVISGTDVSININAAPDKRSYRVDFSLFQLIAPNHQPKVTLEASVRGLKEGLSRAGFKDLDFRKSDFIRLNLLERLIKDDYIDESLRLRR